MSRTIEDLPPDVRTRYPFTSRFVTVNGRRMHYVDEGPADAPPVLLLHGNPTWGYLWRDVVPPLLTASLRVVEQSGGRFGLQTMCEAGGTANASIIERLDR